MAIKSKFREDPEINMGPFADIAFLLIIFFILATSLMQPKGRRIDMPASSESQSKEEKKNLTIDVQPSAILFGRSEENMGEVTEEELSLELSKLKLAEKKEEDRMVVVKTGKGVPYSQFFKVMTAVSRAGGMATLLQEEEAEE